MAGLVPLTPQAAQARVMPSDALMLGVHSSLRVASKHKKMVSAVLHLKRESIGKKGHPTAFSGGPKAFGMKSKSIKLG